MYIVCVLIDIQAVASMSNEYIINFVSRIH